MKITDNLTGAIETVLLHRAQLRVLLGSEEPPVGDTAAGITRYGAESPAFQIWMALRAVDELSAVWAQCLPAPPIAGHSVDRPDAVASPELITKDDECIACQ